MKKSFLSAIIFTACFLFAALPCHAGNKNAKTPANTPEIIQTIEAIAQGQTMQPRETNAVRVTIKPLYVIFKISF